MEQRLGVVVRKHMYMFGTMCSDPFRMGRYGNKICAKSTNTKSVTFRYQSTTTTTNAMAQKYEINQNGEKKKKKEKNSHAPSYWKHVRMKMFLVFLITIFWFVFSDC